MDTHPADAWRAEANCRGSATSIFYAPRGQSQDTPRLLCAACPVRAECLTDAVEHREVYGMWGGAAGKTLRRLKRAFWGDSERLVGGCTHRDDPAIREGCGCSWCTAAREHFAALDEMRFADSVRFIRPGRRRSVDHLTHGQAATYNAGCRCEPCRLAKAIYATRRPA